MEKLSFDRNIVQFYGAVLSAPAPMLVLEYMEGGDLRDALSHDIKNELGWYKSVPSPSCCSASLHAGLCPSADLLELQHLLNVGKYIVSSVPCCAARHACAETVCFCAACL